jgi:hypothetical protein
MISPALFMEVKDDIEAHSTMGGCILYTRYAPMQKQKKMIIAKFSLYSHS